MTINIFMHIYIGENAHWDIYAPPWQKHHTIFFYYFFHFRCILLQISHQKCFFISISIPGRSGVKPHSSAISDSILILSMVSFRDCINMIPSSAKNSATILQMLLFIPSKQSYIFSIMR